MSADGDDSGGSLILLNTPDWWQDITKAGGLFRYVLLVIVSAILAFWEAVIGTFADVMFWLWDAADVSIPFVDRVLPWRGD